MKKCTGHPVSGLPEHYTDENNFHRNKYSQDGLQSMCKSCKQIANKRTNRGMYKKKYNDRTNNSGKAYAASVLGYYVYFHRDVDGTVVYIGKGKLDRAYNITGRLPEHADWLVDQVVQGNNWVELQDKCMTEAEALNLEHHLIVEYSPRFNIAGKELS